jgi:uncharacterized protein
MMTPETTPLANRLAATFADLQTALVAFSGGIDSSVVLAAACRALGPDRVMAATGASETYTAEEAATARAFCAALGVEHIVLTTQELASESFASNPPDRCYHCKKELYDKLEALRVKRGADALLDGTHAGDAGDYRPGLRAAREHGVRSPLREAGLGKDDVRALARAWGVPAPDRPANPCLASRIPYGTRITAAALEQVAAGERALRALGFADVRVRHHGPVARVEVAPADLPRLLDADLRKRVSQALHAAGFRWVALDLDGYRMGSLNEALAGRERAL